MLFLVTHEHTAETCPVDNPKQVRQLLDAKHIKDAGAKVVGSYIAPPEHVLYFVLEADDYSKVVKYLRPMMKIGTPDIVPVQTLEEALGIFPKGRRTRATRSRATRSRAAAPKRTTTRRKR